MYNERAAVNLESVMAQLKALGSENARKIYAQQGAGDNQFGVGLGKVRGLADELKTDHPLALQLWATGNADAMILATMLMAPGQLTAREIERMVKPLTYAKLADELVENVVTKTPFSEALRTKWIDAKDELAGRAGWRLMIARVLEGAKGLDLDALLIKLEAEMLRAPKRKQEVMNRCLVEIGVHFPEFTQRCVEIGERLGRFDKRPVPRGCVSPYAPEWIAAVLKRKK